MRRISGPGEQIPDGFVGALRRSAPGARHEVDHHHREIEFDLVVKGGGSYALDDQLHPLRPGTLIWLMPGRRHRLIRAPGLEMWVVTLRPELIDPTHHPALAATPLRQLPGEELVDFDRLMSQVAQDSHAPDVYNAGLTYIALRARLASQSAPSATRAMHPAVARAVLLLRQDDAVSLSDLARAAGVTPTYLSRLLVEHTGRSFVDWRNRIRLDRFMEAYRPGANLLAAALDAGFGSYARFHHVFNAMVGCTPSDWAHQADGAAQGMPPPIDGHGMPGPDTLSARQHWTALLPLVAPPLRRLLGTGFLDRLLAAHPAGTPPAPQRDHMDAGLSPPERARLVANLRTASPEAAAELARLLDTHDFAGTFARILDAYGLSPASLADAVAALLLLAWVAATHGGDLARAQVAAVASQVRATLAAPGLDARTLQDAHTALICQFAIGYHALEAARAAGSSRARDRLAEAATQLGQTGFGGTLGKLDLTPGGFVRRG